LNLKARHPSWQRGYMKIGDKIKRKPQFCNGVWYSRKDKIVTVTDIDSVGITVSEFPNDRYAWDPEFFTPVTNAAILTEKLHARKN